MLGCNPIQSGFSRVLLFISGLCWFYPGRRTERCDEYSLGFLKQQKKKKEKRKRKKPKAPSKGRLRKGLHISVHLQTHLLGDSVTPWPGERAAQDVVPVAELTFLLGGPGAELTRGAGGAREGRAGVWVGGGHRDPVSLFRDPWGALGRGPWGRALDPESH